MSEMTRSPQTWVGAWSERRAMLTPERVGLIDETTGKRFTYAQLDHRANRTARLLERHGVTDGGRVAVISRNRPEVVDLFFGTGKTGGVLAPLSHRLAPPELGALLETVDPELLVVESRFLDNADATLDGIADLNPALVPIQNGDESRAQQVYEESLPADSSPVVSPDVSPSDTHLLLHTGGTTGTPKETVVSHRAIVWNSLNTIASWGLRDDDLTPLAFPMFHTGGWNVITVPLWHMGGTVVIAREFGPGDLLRTIAQEGASVFVAVPAVLRAMVEHDQWDECDLSSLRLAKSGGGPCRQSVLEAWWARDVELSQGYGLTECGPNNFAMPAGWPREKADSVGKPAIHVDARIVEDGTPVPQGTVGELQLRSPHAATAYLDSPEETEVTFGSGWVSTGDLARVDDDGYYHIEGRRKELFVSGGENVYPAEVEAAISDHDAVSEVVVIPVPDEQWGQVGKAVIEPVSGSDPFSLSGLRSFLNDRLARFKHPRELVFVDVLPTSGAGKIDRDGVKERFGGHSP